VCEFLSAAAPHYHLNERKRKENLSSQRTLSPKSFNRDMGFQKKATILGMNLIELLINAAVIHKAWKFFAARD